MINSICVRLYCCESPSLIENYEEALKDDTETWQIHHRLELFDDGAFANSVDDLKRKGLYYHRPAFELIFLKKKDHLRIHNLLTGKNPESLESQAKKVKEKWKDEDFRKRCSAKSCNSWATKKIQGLPDQRKDNKTYIREYHKLYRSKIKPGYLTFKQQLKKGLIPKDSTYESWVKFYVPYKQHPWLKK